MHCLLLMSLPAVAAPPRTIGARRGGQERGRAERSSGQHGEKARGDRMRKEATESLRQRQMIYQIDRKLD